MSAIDSGWKKIGSPATPTLRHRRRHPGALAHPNCVDNEKTARESIQIRPSTGKRSATAARAWSSWTMSSSRTRARAASTPTRPSAIPRPASRSSARPFTDGRWARSSPASPASSAGAHQHLPFARRRPPLDGGNEQRARRKAVAVDGRYRRARLQRDAGRGIRPAGAGGFQRPHGAQPQARHRGHARVFRQHDGRGVSNDFCSSASASTASWKRACARSPRPSSSWRRATSRRAPSGPAAATPWTSWRTSSTRPRSRSARRSGSATGSARWSRRSSSR